MNKKMKMVLVIGLAALLAVAGLSLTKNTKNSASDNYQETTETTAANGEHAQFVTYTEAIEKAKAENKAVLVDVYTDWCVWCKRMDKDVYTDPKVKAELEKYFVAAKLDAEASTERMFRGNNTTETQIAQNLKVSGYPTTVFMTPDEQVIQIVPGYIKAPDFALALRFIGTKAYETQNFEEWKKTQS